ncbi:MAG: heme-copper oxidase subunit III [Candidatus Eremiobacteraeota bacterium]|nr:heme-copper oxidase subunit III [Candidatus Eremiobacteraeota bacterium]MBC5827135.1 heme-copper oxidase subunit III [Candidatus Eremiobacteraeota bacterium]
MASEALLSEDALYSEIRGQRLLGFLLFLISDCILFSSFIFAYLYMRSSVAVWPPPGVGKADLYVAAVNSIVLFGSGATMHYAIEGFKHGKRGRFLGFMIATIVLGSLFLSGQAYEYSHLAQLKTTWPGSTYGASFFTLTGMHGFHVFVGVVFLIIVLLQTLRGTYDRHRYFGLTAATLYWHFVDVIWVALFFLLYVY